MSWIELIQSTLVGLGPSLSLVEVTNIVLDSLCDSRLVTPQADF